MRSWVRGSQRDRDDDRSGITASRNGGEATADSKAANDRTIDEAVDEVAQEATSVAEHSRERALAGDGTHYVRGVHPDAVGHYVDGVLEGRYPALLLATCGGGASRTGILTRVP